jgi:hypothetical protein
MLVNGVLVYGLSQRQKRTFQGSLFCTRLVWRLREEKGGRYGG